MPKKDLNDDCIIVSNYHLINFLRDCKELSHYEFVAAFVLASRRNAVTLQCNPSYGTIAKDMRVCRQTAVTSIKRLIAKNVIIKVYNRDGTKQYSNHYIFTFDKEDAKELSEVNIMTEYGLDELEKWQN